MLNTLTQVTETKNKFTGLPLGSRAVQIADGTTTDYFPHDLWTRHSRNRVLVRSENGPQSFAGAAPSQWSCRDAESGGWRSRRSVFSPRVRRPKAGHRGNLSPQFQPQTNRGEIKQLVAQVASVGEDKAQRELVLNDVFWAVLNSKSSCSTADPGLRISPLSRNGPGSPGRFLLGNGNRDRGDQEVSKPSPPLPPRGRPNSPAIQRKDPIHLAFESVAHLRVFQKQENGLGVASAQLLLDHPFDFGGADEETIFKVRSVDHNSEIPKIKLEEG